jgi:predicted dehydrogenase
MFTLVFFSAKHRVIAMDRRHFTKLSALTLAATQLPALESSAQTADYTIGYAPVGLGDISNTFMKQVQHCRHSKITGLVTGHPAEKGTKYSAEYNVPQSSVYTYKNYDSIRDNKAIDAVYIGLPNSMHMEYTVRAAEAGKHVLCEKPMANSPAECRRMIDACKAHNVKLMVAYRLQYDAHMQHLRDLIRDGAVGEIISVGGEFFGQKSYPQWRLDKALAGGGSLNDMGIYPLNTIRYLIGETPTEFKGMVSTREKGPRFAQVEQTVQWVMKFPSGVLGDCGSSYGESPEAYLYVNGTTGGVQLQKAYGNNPDYTFSGTAKAAAEARPFPAVTQYQFGEEADSFAANIHDDTEPIAGGDEGLKDMICIEAIYKSAETPIA